MKLAKLIYSTGLVFAIIGLSGCVSNLPKTENVNKTTPTQEENAFSPEKLIYGEQAFTEAKQAIKDKNYAKAIELLTIGCENGKYQACVGLGNFYYSGNSVKEDPVKALELFDKACKNGVAMGCCKKGHSYEDGKGVAQDFTKAKELYSQSCDAGWQGGCMHLGDLYKNGNGVEKSKEMAIKYYKKALEIAPEFAPAKAKIDALEKQ